MRADIDSRLSVTERIQLNKDLTGQSHWGDRLTLADDAPGQFVQGMGKEFLNGFSFLGELGINNLGPAALINTGFKATSAFHNTESPFLIDIPEFETENLAEQGGGNAMILIDAVTLPIGALKTGPGLIVRGVTKLDDLAAAARAARNAGRTLDLPKVTLPGPGGGLINLSDEVLVPVMLADDTDSFVAAVRALDVTGENLGKATRIGDWDLVVELGADGLPIVTRATNASDEVGQLVGVGARTGDETAAVGGTTARTGDSPAQMADVSTHVDGPAAHVAPPPVGPVRDVTPPGHPGSGNPLASSINKPPFRPGVGPDRARAAAFALTGDANEAAELVAMIAAHGDDGVRAAEQLATAMIHARTTKTAIDSLAGRIATRFDGRLAAAPIKGPVRALEKVLDKYAYDVDRLGDLARNTIVVPAEKIDDVVRALRSAGSDVEVVRHSHDSLGYSGVNSKIDTPSGTGEIQVNTPEMIFAKEPEANARGILGDAVYNEIASRFRVPGGRGHDIYEQYRGLDPTSAEALALAGESIEYYALFQ